MTKFLVIIFAVVVVCVGLSIAMLSNKTRVIYPIDEYLAQTMFIPEGSNTACQLIDGDAYKIRD